ncbi:Protein kinase-like domain protein [Akanthomyces lecanii RCEF 1005]|uniref:non-specific serine/threonine protein kinase n=1 Tax=Akanthomyces lecanii RCEF 1005 TaxID=1081108 RepID=A0A168JIG3_CORDF|nr:Protein kinase-like domain protein [Akanthomyces lecanii RCEF 1005]
MANTILLPSLNPKSEGRPPLAYPANISMADISMVDISMTDIPMADVSVADTPIDPISVDISQFVLAPKALGSGAFGAVRKAVHPRTKQVLAAKVQTPRPFERQYLRREINILGQLRHPNIVRCYGYKESGPSVQIFMDLKDCNLQDLVHRQAVPEDDLTMHVYHDVLKGLDYLSAFEEFYSSRFEACQYSLFSRAAVVVLLGRLWAQQHSGSGTHNLRFRNVHCARDPCRTQTTVVDMWSLFVTLAWTNNWEGIRGQEFDGFKESLSWITSTARLKWNNMQDLQELTVTDHTKRATAAQMLIKVFNGDGLTTERQLVPSLRPVEAPTRADIPDMASFLDGPEAPPP